MKLKRFVFFFAVISPILFPAMANSQNVVDVITYSNQNDLEDPYHLSALLQRCAGVHMGYAKYLPSDMQQQKEGFAKIAENLIVMAGMFLREKQMTSDEENLKQITTAFLFFTDHYYSKIEQTQLATGSIFSGKVLEEFQYCQSVAKEMQ